MTEVFEELYDYAELRSLEVPAMFVPCITSPVLVLGGSQSSDVLNLGSLEGLTVRRRRGGGGLVFLQPGDIWVDWWIPASDQRWSRDVYVSSLRCGYDWHAVLLPRVKGQLNVHEGSLEGETAHRVICFAGKGPGEVFVDGRKAVGVTQWRVREGIFLSSVLHAHDSRDVLAFLIDVPDGLAEAIDHHVLSSLAISDAKEMLEDLRQQSGPGALLHPDFPD